MIFLTYVVIIITLVLPGLTLPALVRKLGLGTKKTKQRPLCGQGACRSSRKPRWRGSMTWR